MGWAALGGFEAILVDNGGPYRSRLTTMLTVILGGAIAGVAGAMATTPLWIAVIVTAGFCFAITFARVLTKEMASTSVIILVIYFAGYGGLTHTLSGALENALAFVLGGLWAAALSVFLWPLDPFRPARLAVAECYAMLAEFTAGVHNTLPDSDDRRQQRQRMHELQRRMRLQMETARAAIGTTGARVTARTIRARSLTVLLETVDILFAGTIRWTELFETAPDTASQQAIADALRWLSRAERAIADSLPQRPADGASSFAPAYFSRGIPFILSSPATLSSLSLGLGLDFGTNQITVELEGNSPFNLPNGTILASGTVAAAVRADSSSTALTTFTPTGPPVVLSAGTTYWVVALPGAADTYAEWNLVSTMGNTASSNNGTSYTQQNNVNLGALVVNGVPAPEPGSATLWTLGAASVLTRFRRRR